MGRRLPQGDTNVESRNEGSQIAKEKEAIVYYSGWNMRNGDSQGSKQEGWILMTFIN